MSGYNTNYYPNLYWPLTNEYWPERGAVYPHVLASDCRTYVVPPPRFSYTVTIPDTTYTVPAPKLTHVVKCEE